jgi:hypothetical protein
MTNKSKILKSESLHDQLKKFALESLDKGENLYSLIAKLEIDSSEEDTKHKLSNVINELDIP